MSPKKRERGEKAEEIPRVDLGLSHFLTFTSWHPDDLPANRKTYDIPKGSPMPHVERAGAIVYHPNLKQPGTECISGINFDLPEMAKARLGSGAVWQVQSWDPLTISPSLLCLVCGDHGFIRDGRWVPA